MEKGQLIEEIKTILTKEQILLEEPMSHHTSFRVGGNAELYLMPDITQLMQLVPYFHKNQIPYMIVGNGSNLLVGDGGIDGVVIELGKRASKINLEVEGEQVLFYVEAGCLLSRLAHKALAQGASGMEFAAGIPGTVGGAVVMNAGAYGGEIKDILRWAKVLTPEGEIVTLSPDQLELSYRHSNVEEKGYVVIEACIALEIGNKNEIRRRMDELKAQRTEKQPLEYPSAGSTFKRPAGHFAGKLIQDAGLKGYQVGGAQVSQKHSGFVINKDHATARDILELIEDVQDKVEVGFGVRLEPEVKMVGKFF